MPDKHTIAAEFAQADGERSSQLEMARRCAALSYPSLLPPSGQTPAIPLPQAYQSLGRYGLITFVGKLFMAMVPPSQPWLRMEMEPRRRFALEAAGRTDDIAKFNDILRLHELLVMTVLESASLVNTNRRRAGFHSQFLAGLKNLAALGSNLWRENDDYTLTVFRYDQFVTCRDNGGNVWRHLIREEKDPLELDDGQRKKLGKTDKEYQEMPPHDRRDDLLTRVLWQPLTKKWLIEQEFDGKIINTSDETVTQFLASEFDLDPGASQGRGFIEAIYPDLASYDNLQERLLDWAALASKLVPVIDPSSELRPKDLTKPTGEAVMARVQGGKVQDFALLTAEKVADFQVASTVHERLRKDLGKQMMIESEIAPQGEAGRSPVSWMSAARQINEATGGRYAQIADDVLMPLAERTMFQLRRDKMLPDLPMEGVSVRTLTGAAALAMQAQFSAATETVTVLSQIPDAAKRIDWGVFTQAMLRFRNVNVPGLILTDAQLEAQAQAEVAKQIQQAAGEKAADTLGNVAEAALTQQLAPQG